MEDHDDDENPKRKPRVLCFHGYRTSGKLLKKSLMSRWPEAVTEKMDLVFFNATFLAHGKCSVEGIDDPPYYEWFHTNEDWSQVRNFEECVAYIEDYMEKNGPFDGLLGSSQGALVAAALPGLQAQVNWITREKRALFCLNHSGTLLSFITQEATQSPNLMIRVLKLWWISLKIFRGWLPWRGTIELAISHVSEA